jgi:hypothetical protein
MQQLITQDAGVFRAICEICIGHYVDVSIARSESPLYSVTLALMELLEDLTMTVAKRRGCDVEGRIR